MPWSRRATRAGSWRRCSRSGSTRRREGRGRDGATASRSSTWRRRRSSSSTRTPRLERTGASRSSLPLVVAADSSGPLIVAVVARRPPLVISRDAGSTWREAGNGLPAGRAVAISPEHPDLILFASESRLYLSRDGGRFWQPLAIELDDIRAVAWLDDGEPTRFRLG